MNHHLVKWKFVKCKSRLGEDVPLGIPRVIDIRYRGTLLSHILSMPKKAPITFESAIRMVSEKQAEAFNQGRFGDEPEQYGWYDLNFVYWITLQGYHIELTGDEFETSQSLLL